MKAKICVLIIPDQIGRGGFPRCDYFASKKEATRYFQVEKFDDLEPYLNDEVYKKHRVEVITKADDRDAIIKEFDGNYWVTLHLERWKIG